MLANCHRTETTERGGNGQRNTAEKRLAAFRGLCGRLGALALSAQYFLKEHLLIRKKKKRTSHIQFSPNVNSWQSDFNSVKLEAVLLRVEGRLAWRSSLWSSQIPVH